MIEINIEIIKFVDVNMYQHFKEKQNFKREETVKIKETNFKSFFLETDKGLKFEFESGDSLIVEDTEFDWDDWKPILEGNFNLENIKKKLLQLRKRQINYNIRNSQSDNKTKFKLKLNKLKQKIESNTIDFEKIIKNNQKWKRIFGKNLG